MSESSLFSREKKTLGIYTEDSNYEKKFKYSILQSCTGPITLYN